MRPIAQRAIRRAILRSIARPMAPAPFRPHFRPDMPHPTLTRTGPGDGGAPSLITDQAAPKPASLITDHARRGHAGAPEENT